MESIGKNTILASADNQGYANTITQYIKEMDMKKQHLERFLVLMLATLCLLMAVSCNTTKSQMVVVPEPAPVVATPVYASVQGTIAVVDKYGNVETDIPVTAMIAAGYELGDILTITIGANSIDAPLVGTYSDVNRGAFLVRPTNDVMALAMSYDNFAGKTGTEAGMAVTLSMAEKAGYLSEYKIRHLEKSQERADYASDPIFANFRNVVMGDIPAGRLYRGCNPVLDDARAPYAAKLVEDAQIRTVINLADSEESMAPNLPAAPYYQQLVNNGQVIALNMGIDFHDPAFTAKLKDGLLFMIDHEGPYYIHCNEGKDRAGMVVALLEALTGATVQEISDDYMVTYMNYYNVMKDDAKYPIISKIIVDLFIQMNGGVPVTDANIQQVAENYTIKTVGLTPEQVRALQAKLS